MNTDIFLKISKEIHGDKYNYEGCNYTRCIDKVKILCKKHGYFYQSPCCHMRGKGCRECGYEKVGTNQTSNTTKFIEKSINIHGDFYNYSKVQYIRSNAKVIITCKEHGDFLQKPNKHLAGQGCRKCGYSKMSNTPKELKKLVNRIKTSVSGAYYRRMYTENSKIYDIIGCSWEDFVKYLENNNFGFKITDDNMDLDHIKPMSEVRTIDEAYVYNHYTNLQLLPSYYNRYVKKNKKFDIDCLRSWL